MDISDGALLAAIRESGKSSAYAELYRRHVDAARAAAHRIAPHLDKEDIVSESFARILQAISNGAGPRDLFRPYMYQTIRNVSIDLKQAAHLDLEEQEELPDPSSLQDLADAIADRDLVSEALSEMPERWRTVLWYTEVEGYTPAAAAPLIGITANNVAQIRSRARKRLRARVDQLAPADSGKRDTGLARRIAVVVLGATTASALLPLFEDGNAKASAVVGAAGAGATALSVKTLTVGGGVVLTGAIIGAILFFARTGPPVPTQPVPAQQTAVPTEHAEQPARKTPKMEDPRMQEEAPARSGDSAWRGTPTPVDPGPWEELPQQPPVIRAPID